MDEELVTESTGYLTRLEHAEVEDIYTRTSGIPLFVIYAVYLKLP